MRIAFCLILLFLAACERPDPSLNCGSLSMSNMTDVQRDAAVKYCSAGEKAEEADTMTNRVKREANELGMTVEEFSETSVGKVVLVKELAAVIVGLGTVLGLWLTGTLFIRYTAWEQEKATRCQWGPFSYWRIEYVRRRNPVFDIPTQGWLLFFSAVAFFVGVGIYSTVVN